MSDRVELPPAIREKLCGRPAICEKICGRIEIDESEVPEWAITDISSPKISGAEKRKISREDFDKKFAKNGKVVV